MKAPSVTLVGCLVALSLVGARPLSAMADQPCNTSSAPMPAAYAEATGTGATPAEAQANALAAFNAQLQSAAESPPHNKQCAQACWNIWEGYVRCRGSAVVTTGSVVISPPTPAPGGGYQATASATDFQFSYHCAECPSQWVPL